MSLNITRRLGEGFILRNKAKSVFKTQGLVRLELLQNIRNQNGIFYEVSVKSDADQLVLLTKNERVTVTKNNVCIIKLRPSETLFIRDKQERWLEAAITFAAASGKQVKVSIDADSNVNIVRDELLGAAA